MEVRKLNQSSLSKICYILGSYECEVKHLEDSEKSVWLVLDNEVCCLPKFVLNEIEDEFGDNFCVCRLGGCLSLLFDKDLSEEVLTIPVINMEEFE